MFDAPMLPVEIDGVNTKRTSVPEVLLYDRTGKATMVRMRPKLQAGERLVERPGQMPMIVMDAPQRADVCTREAYAEVRTATL